MVAAEVVLVNSDVDVDEDMEGVMEEAVEVAVSGMGYALVVVDTGLDY